MNETEALRKAPPLRYTMLLDEDAAMAVERLREAYKLKTKAATYDLAIRILAWVTEQHADGYEVGRAKGDTFQPLILPSTGDEESSNG
jgi:hypothetical protein